MGGKVTGPYEELTYQIIGAAMAVHRRIGPGEKEITYQRALEIELEQKGLAFEPQKNLPVHDGERLLGYYIPDFIVEEKIIVEIKAFSNVHPKYLGQVITYLNHAGLSIGLLINFGEGKLNVRRVFPSSQKLESLSSYQWIFVPDWLSAKDQEELRR